ncbi:MAG: pantetheine-phosphate adenylyltransferase [Candidatus Binatota bacterium]|nr:pantetheine-phosphate adenylyltransferase [Candidatus Binatota bacterium]
MSPRVIKRGAVERVAVFPGSFDPITNGHLDIIDRSLQVFDRVIVAVAFNRHKDSALFTPEERVEMIVECTKGRRVVADSFSGLLVDYARATGAHVIIRGLRAVADFEYEFQMALMNRHLRPEIETFFVMAGEAHFYTSSRLVKEVAGLGGDISGLVPRTVQLRLGAKLGLRLRRSRS